MNRLKLYIAIFCLAISLPLGFLIYQSYGGLKQEERAQLRYFSETLFDQMERALAELVQSEEGRAVDEYQFFLAGSPGDRGAPQPSPLSDPVYPDYILGYLQNNPDGSFQTPLADDLGSVEPQHRDLVRQLREANELFNQRKVAIPAAPAEPPAVVSETEVQQKQKLGFGERFLKRAEPDSAPSYLGKKSQRLEEISPEQAMNVAQDLEAVLSDQASAPAESWHDAPLAETTVSGAAGSPEAKGVASSRYRAPVKEEAAALDEFKTQIAPPPQASFQVEVAPFQSVALQDEKIYMFRRIVIDDQIYRQGFIILTGALMDHLADTYFADQPLADFTSLELKRRDLPNGQGTVRAGIEPPGSNFLASRVFPQPFDFLSVSLAAGSLPASPTRRSLNMALALLGAVLFIGLFAIYQSARAIVELSERRSQFVSSVTHELKTPLTNIRMYVEMLDQGIAPTPEREQEYLAILGSESARLSGLINNVLELAKLEKKQRHFDLRETDLDDTLAEVETIMTPKITMEGFSLVLNKTDIPPFPHDREVLVQILVNLLENSMKFGKNSPERSITISTDLVTEGVRIRVSDTGPGIPKRALKKVFDDFYRVDNDLTRTTGGTGIGLALVQKFVTALGGTVTAQNNQGPGCTITIVLPRQQPLKP